MMIYLRKILIYTLINKYYNLYSNRNYKFFLKLPANGHVVLGNLALVAQLWYRFFEEASRAPTKSWFFHRDDVDNSSVLQNTIAYRPRLHDPTVVSTATQCHRTKSFRAKRTCQKVEWINDFITLSTTSHFFIV